MSGMSAACLVGIALVSGSVSVRPPACAWLDGDAVYSFLVWYDVDKTISLSDRGRLAMLRVERGWDRSVTHLLPAHYDLVGRGCATLPVRCKVVRNRCYLTWMVAELRAPGEEAINPVDRIRVQAGLFSYPMDILSSSKVGIGGTVNWNSDNPDREKLSKGFIDEFTFIGHKILKHYPGSETSAKANDPVNAFDFHVTDNCAIEVYFRRDGSLYRQDRTFRGPNTIVVGAETRWAAKDCGWFRVVAHGDRRLLVTDTGKVLAVPAPDSPRRSLETVWDDDPVRVLIYDAVRGGAFAFTDKAYFAVSEGIRQKVHAIGPLRTGTAQEMTESIRQCTRVIMAESIAKGSDRNSDVYIRASN